MSGNVIREKSFAFAVRIVKLCSLLADERREFVLSKQLLRSGTAIGALVREAEHAESKADFIHKMAIAQKEANETAYWLELLRESDLLSQKEFDSIFSDQAEIAKILASIILTSKGKKKMVNDEW
ncbi:four helix bundle protein [Nitrosomonas ureae]|uniref:Four helix bundle protein n=1 Tax=Nitrosomonas ureae TaxID=44577 RepID=A0A285BZ43_9PROT|nr:four helix bundle protein [Nitrosomonas ureae]SNX60581.1 four helix bundle protein [Nitrosomonas ureae]